MLFQPNDYEREALDQEGSLVVLFGSTGAHETSLFSSFGPADFVAIVNLVSKHEGEMARKTKEFFKENFSLQ